MRIGLLILFLSLWIVDEAFAFDNATGKPVVLSQAQLATVRSIVAGSYAYNRETVRLVRADAARDGHGELIVCVLSRAKNMFGSDSPVSFALILLKPTGELTRTIISNRRAQGLASFDSCRNAHVNLHFQVH
jgi:hypothetical protein